MTQASTFTFSGHTWNASTRKATFSYTINHKDETFSFTETLVFPSEQALSAVPEALLHNALDTLSLALGISYYKLFCPKTIILETIQLSKEQAAFWNTIYTKGLGEFFYQNKIDFHGLINFPSTDTAPEAISFPRQDRSLVGVGGGKDSLVAGELLKAAKKPFTAFVVNEHPIKEQTIELLAVDKLLITREIDPLLLELNKRHDTYNGHVPFSTHMACISLVTALLYDYRYTIFANEESASYGSLTYLGEEINHQWSKSFAFEQLFQNYVKQFVTPDVSYFSLLRPLSELAIAKEFVKHASYFPVFSSCNKNFKIVEKTDTRWCGECPKCAFTFIMLAAFLSKDQVLSIFGQNLLAKESLLSTYKELLGVANQKPFDCVGTPDEVRVAFFLAREQKAYDETVSMRFFTEEVAPTISSFETLKKAVFRIFEKQAIPQAFAGVLPYDN